MRAIGKGRMHRHPRSVPLTPSETDRRVAALRAAQKPAPIALVPTAAPSAPEESNVTPAAMPEWVDMVAAPAKGLRITATISITMIDRGMRPRADVIRSAMEALLNAQSEGAADEMIDAAGEELFDVERVQLFTREPEVRI